ncbi:MAG: peptide ABC transporter permease [Verrucomicrobia bacterium 12-59-8]|nr:MAG: peptide ABC transporter permease [Verrucomicrobia bacterium 12-59-8]
MFPFLLRRAFSSVIVIFCVISITFVLARITKGGPFDTDKAVSDQVMKAKLARYHLDGTVLQQYFAYVSAIAHFDLGVSTRYRDWRVSELLRQKMPNSFALGTLAFVIASCAGVFLGSLAAMKKDTWIDRSAMFGALLSISIPSFISGPFLIAVFALWLGWLPVGGWGTASQMILPAICLAAPYIAYVARLMRNSLLDVLKSDFLRTARAKGLTETQAVARHAIKVAILPVITFLGPLAAHLLTGSMIVESVFNISGAGMIFVNSIQNRDVFLLGGAVIVYCMLLVLFNLFVDVIYTLLDKRIKLYA